MLEKVRDNETVGDDGYRRIRSDIIFGRLHPDQKLQLEALKEHYGVSISTLRGDSQPAIFRRFCGRGSEARL